MRELCRQILAQLITVGTFIKGDFSKLCLGMIKLNYRQCDGICADGGLENFSGGGTG